MPLGELFNPILCIGWLIVGAIAGAIAHNVMRGGNQPLLNDIVLGIVGSWVGGLIMSVLGFGAPSDGIERLLVNMLVAIVGAILVIGVMRAINRAT